MSYLDARPRKLADASPGDRALTDLPTSGLGCGFGLLAGDTVARCAGFFATGGGGFDLPVCTLWIEEAEEARLGRNGGGMGEGLDMGFRGSEDSAGSGMVLVRPGSEGGGVPPDRSEVPPVCRRGGGAGGGVSCLWGEGATSSMGLRPILAC